MKKINGMNMKDVSSKNRELLMRLLYAKGAISRKEIAKRMGLTSAAITKMCNKLIQDGMIHEVGTVEGTAGHAGRREILLEPVTDGKYVLGINAEVGSVTYTLANMAGKIFELKKVPFTADIEQLMDIAEDFIAENSVNLDQISQIGICIIGSKAENGFGQWDEDKVRELVINRHNIPLVVTNNVRGFAEAELLFGDDYSSETVLFVKWGHGIGSCIARNGRVVSDNRDGIASLGHYIVNPNGKLCKCGRRGCLQAEVGDALIKSQITEDKLDEMALCIANAVTLLDAKQVVLFGPVFTKDIIVNKLIMKCELYNPAIKKGMIREAKINNKSGYIGPVAICINEHIKG